MSFRQWVVKAEFKITVYEGITERFTANTALEPYIKKWAKQRKDHPNPVGYKGKSWLEKLINKPSSMESYTIQGRVWKLVGLTFSWLGSWQSLFEFTGQNLERQNMRQIHRTVIPSSV